MKGITARDQIEKVYIISLKESKRRHYYSFEDKLFSFHDAIDSRINPEESIKNNEFHLDIIKYHSHMNKFNGSYGCYMSHYSLWEKIAKTHSFNWFLILEDDACPKSVSQFLKEKVDFDKVFQKNKAGILNCNKRGSRGSNAYLVTRKSCVELIKSLNKTIFLPTDRTLFQGDQLGVHKVKSKWIRKRGEEPYIIGAPWKDERDIINDKNVKKQNTLAVINTPKSKGRYRDIVNELQVNKDSCIIGLTNNFRSTEFSKTISKFEDYDVFFFNNEKAKSFYRKRNNATNVNLSDEHCIEKGYRNFGKNEHETLEITNVDKAACFLSEVLKKCIENKQKFYKDIWFISEEVLLFEEKTLIDIDRKYRSQQLLCGNITSSKNISDEEELWRIFGQNIRKRFAVENKFLYNSNLKAFRIKPQMILSYDSYSQHHSKLFYYKQFLPTYAYLNGFRVLTPPEMKTLMSSEVKWNIEDINKKHLYAPVSDQDQKEIKEKFKTNSKEKEQLQQALTY